MWKLKSSKLSLSIRDKTQHQRKHLNSIQKIKSRIDDKQPWKKSTSSLRSSRSQNFSLSPYAKNKMEHQNYLLANKIIDMSKKLKKKQPYFDKYNQMSLSLSTRVYNTRNHSKKVIQKQNASMFQRLVTARPLYKNKCLQKFASDNNKYKSNILKSKVYNVDYTKLATSAKKPSINKFKLLYIANE